MTTIKVKESTRTKLNVIAAYTGEKQCEVAERLADAEHNKIIQKVKIKTNDTNTRSRSANAPKRVSATTNYSRGK